MDDPLFIEVAIIFIHSRIQPFSYKGQGSVHGAVKRLGNDCQIGVREFLQDLIGSLHLPGLAANSHAQAWEFIRTKAVEDGGHAFLSG